MKYIKDFDIPLICLIAFVIRLLIVGASVGDSIALLGLAGLFGFIKFISKKDEDWKLLIEKELKQLRNEVISARLNNTIVRKANEAKTSTQKEASNFKRFF